MADEPVEELRVARLVEPVPDREAAPLDELALELPDVGAQPLDQRQLGVEVEVDAVERHPPVPDRVAGRRDVRERAVERAVDGVEPHSARRRPDAPAQQLPQLVPRSGSHGRES